MADIFKVVALALIEGVTEFLPISSTGHLIVGKALLNFDAMGVVFEVFIQIGAVVAVVVHYRHTLRDLVFGVKRDEKARKLWLLLLVAATPAGLLGFLLDDAIESFLFSPVVVGASLIFGGVAFLLVEKMPQFSNNGSDQALPLTELRMRQALVVGILQVLALVPGMSRSGTTIVGGMLAGMNRRLATEFSFFLAIPVLGVATLYKLGTSLNELQTYDFVLLFVGAAFSAIFAWLTIGWLLRFISRNSFVPFGYYRILAGLLVLAGSASGYIA